MNEETIYNKIDTLPKALRFGIFSIDIKDTVESICASYYIDEDQTKNIYLTTLSTVAGLLGVKDIVYNIQESAGISKELAITLSIEINNEVIQTIREIVESIIIVDKIIEEGGKNDSLDSNEDHSNLDRNQILREIETPAPSKIINPVARKKPEEYNDAHKSYAKSDPYHEPIE